MNNLIEILKDTDYQIPRQLLLNYKKLNITDSELILLIYLINNNLYNPKEISSDLSIELNEVLDGINSLSEKGIISIDMIKVNNKVSETINLDLLYEKLAFNLINKEEKSDNTIYDTFEKEFGRTLSPMEYEIINGWKEKDISDEIILLALKEAIYNGVTNFRYIDKIIYEWNKKGIKTKQDVEKNKKNFKTSKNTKELFDYDWLNDDENN